MRHIKAKGIHTSEPWKVYHAQLRPQFPGDRIIEIQDDHGNAVVTWSGHLANAMVMAAAPTMLRMMKQARPILANFCESDENIKLYDEFCDAIAKAEGRR